MRDKKQKKKKRVTITRLIQPKAYIIKIININCSGLTVKKKLAKKPKFLFYFFL